MKIFFRIALFIVLFFYFIRLPYSTLIGGFFFPAIMNTAFSVLFIYLGFFYEKYLDWFRKSAYICAVAFPWVICLIPDQRIKVGITILFFLFIAAAGIWELFFKRSEFSYLLFLSGAFLLLMLEFLKDINYLEGEETHFLISPFLGIICIFVFLYLHKKQIIFLPDIKFSEICFAVVILSAMAAYCVLSSANYAFDISEGNSQEVQVSDVYSERFGRGKRKYLIKVDYNGEETQFEINPSKHSSIRIGDTVTVTHYDGFLGDEYIIVNE